MRLLHQPQNLLSNHLHLLYAQDVITERRSTADECSVYYSLNLDMLRTLFFASADALHPALSLPKQELQVREMHLPRKPLRVLFLCTHNSARSQMAEGLLRAYGGSRYQVFSAGAHPRHVHLLAIQVMAEADIDISEIAGHRAKGITEFADHPPMDLVVTFCDEAAEECPYFPNAHRQEHWGFPDPSAANGIEEERLAVFRQVRDAIAARIETFLAHQPFSATQAPAPSTRGGEQEPGQEVES